MAQQQERKSSHKSKGLFGKLSFRKKAKIRHRTAVLDDEESLVCDDKHETDNSGIIKLQGRITDKPETVRDTRNCHSGSEGSMKERSAPETGTIKSRQIQRDSAEIRCQSSVELTDINLYESKVGFTAERTPANARVVRINAIIESDIGSAAKRSLGENKDGFLVISAELNKSQECLLQSESSALPSHSDNLFVSNGETSAINGEVSEVQLNTRAEYKTENNHPHESLGQEHAIEVDVVADSPACVTVPCISAPAISRNERREDLRNKKERKKIRKSNRKSRNKENFEIIADEETSFHALSSDCKDTETIEILAMDPETKKESKKKRRKKAKRIVTKAGLTAWKGIRTGWKLMWNGLAMYTLPLGSLDVSTNIAKFWSAKFSSSQA